MSASVPPASGGRTGSRRVRWIAIGVGVVLVSVVLLLASQVGGDPTAADRTSPLLGKKAPDVTVTTLDGTRVSLESLRGKTVLVNFWNTWCIPCKEEAPALKSFAKQWAHDPTVALVGIVRDDEVSRVRSHDAKTPSGWLTGLDPKSFAALAFATKGQPETFSITPDGLVAGFQYGPASEADLTEMLRSARGT